MLTEAERARLIEEARAAAARAFLTVPGGTCYGAAVLTRAGNTYTAGQYSSWNHVTNIHAEHGALLIATMNDEPDVVALALASTSDEPVASPCGICRQVMKEHADRTGRNFEVLMAHRRDADFDRSSVQELLPLAWTAQSQLGSSLVSPLEKKHRDAALKAGRAPGGPLAVGDHVVLTDGALAMVWDGQLEENVALVKIKYAPTGEQGWRKIPHSFTEPLKYQAELYSLGWARPTRTGAIAATIRQADVSRHFPALPLEAALDRVPGPVLDVLAGAGVGIPGIRVTGSRSLGLQHAESDWDLVVPVAPDQLPKVRAALFDAVKDGALKIPTTSGTWKLLDRLFTGGRQNLLDQQRFIDTVLSDRTPVALIFVPTTPRAPLLDESWQPLGRGLLHGKVTEARHAAYKRAEYIIQTEEQGRLEVICYHKVANLLRAGDRVSVRGWLMCSGCAFRLIQFLPVPDNILWHETGYVDRVLK